MYPTTATTTPAAAPRDTNRAYRQWADGLDLGPGLKATLHSIISFMYGAPTAWPAVPTLARRRGVKPRQIRKDTAELVRLKIIKKVAPAADARKRQGTVTYILMIPEQLYKQAYIPRSADVYLDRSADVLQDMEGVSSRTPEVNKNHKNSPRARVRETAPVPGHGRATAPRGGAPRTAQEWRNQPGAPALGLAAPRTLSDAGRAAREAVRAVLRPYRPAGRPAHA